MSTFVPGLELARAYYDEVVSPLVGSVRHSAALIGSGSDVLGFDTVRSTDHGWGPRVRLFVTVRPFHSRPYRVLASERFADACLVRVKDPWLRSCPPIGGVDQISDSTDVLEDAAVFARVARLYGWTT